MADDRLEQAVDIIARHVIARAATETQILQRLYDDVLTGEDWRAVVRRVRDLAAYPDGDQYAAAYDFLAGRAEGVEP